MVTRWTGILTCSIVCVNASELNGPIMTPSWVLVILLVLPLREVAVGKPIVNQEHLQQRASGDLMTM